LLSCRGSERDSALIEFLIFLNRTERMTSLPSIARANMGHRSPMSAINTLACP
jgi:hypothetical protein